MNKLYVILISAVILVAGSVQAQTGKFGHVNSQELLGMMPETAQAEKDLQVFQGQLEKRLKELQSGYQMEIENFQNLPADTPETTVNDMRNGILTIEQRIQEFQVSAERDLMAKRETILSPIITKLQGAIDTVGTENEFTYIFDTSTGAIVFQGGGVDITPMVKTKLGITG
jgi:outer membrane protein